MDRSYRRFADRADAGRQLADELGAVDDAVVLALPRGGVPVAYEIAHRLRAPLDVVVARKLGAPGRPELGIGALAEGGARVLNERLVGMLGVRPEQLQRVAEVEQEELQRRVDRYRGDRALPDLHDRTAVVVDDGLATGVTAEAAVAAVRQLGPGRLVLAVPVAAPDTIDRLRPQVDDIVAVTVPPDFDAVGRWYDDFDQTTDQEVLSILDAAARELAHGRAR